VGTQETPSIYIYIGIYIDIHMILYALHYHWHVGSNGRRCLCHATLARRYIEPTILDISTDLWSVYCSFPLLRSPTSWIMSNWPSSSLNIVKDVYRGGWLMNVFVQITGLHYTIPIGLLDFL